MPFQTSNQLLDTLPSAKLSRADETTQKKYEATLTALLTEGQRLIQDCPDQAHIAQATEIFKAIGYNAYESHPAFDQLIVESVKGLVTCAKQHAVPSNNDVLPDTSSAQSALLHAANIVTNPVFRYEVDEQAPVNPETGKHPMRQRLAYSEQGAALRHSITVELLNLANICAEKESKPLRQGSFALNCIEWAYRLATRKSGIKAEAAKAYGDYTKCTNNPEGTDIRAITGEAPLGSVIVEIKSGPTEVERASTHHHRVTPSQHQVVIHGGSPRQ